MLANLKDNPLPFLDLPFQLGFVVKDFEAALRYWTEDLKVGPFVTFEESLGDRQFFHRDKVSDVSMKVAIGYKGDVQIEIIQQLNSAPSNYTEFLDAGREGLHHICFFPESFEQADAVLQELGFVEVSSIRTREGQKNSIYYEGPAHFGAQLELAPLTAARKVYFGGIKAMAANWDGTQPVRRYKTRAEFMSSPECAVGSA